MYRLLLCYADLQCTDQRWRVRSLLWYRPPSLGELPRYGSSVRLRTVFESSTVPLWLNHLRPPSKGCRLILYFVQCTVRIVRYLLVLQRGFLVLICYTSTETQLTPRRRVVRGSASCSCLPFSTFS